MAAGEGALTTKPSGWHGSATIPANSFQSTSAASAIANTPTSVAGGGSASDVHHRDERDARRRTRKPEGGRLFAIRAARISRAGN